MAYTVKGRRGLGPARRLWCPPPLSPLSAKMRRPGLSSWEIEKTQRQVARAGCDQRQAFLELFPQAGARSAEDAALVRLTVPHHFLSRQAAVEPGAGGGRKRGVFNASIPEARPHAGAVLEARQAEHTAVRLLWRRQVVQHALEGGLPVVGVRELACVAERRQRAAL